MTEEFRIRCSGEGKRHELHGCWPTSEDAVESRIAYLEKQPWTKPCRPFVVESREVGPWLLVGQQELTTK